LCIGDHALLNNGSIAEDLEKFMGLPPDTAVFVAQLLRPRCEARMSGYPPHLSAWDGRSRPPQSDEDLS
jgi:hypothetical protein